MWPTSKHRLQIKHKTFILGLSEAAQRCGRLFEKYLQIKHKALSWDLVRLHKHVVDYARIAHKSNTKPYPGT